MGEPTEISDTELDEIEKANDYDPNSDVPLLVAALRSTRERLVAAEAVCEALPRVAYQVMAEGGDAIRAYDAWRALAHPTTEEPTE